MQGPITVFEGDLLSLSPAEARGAVITWGDTVYHLGDVAPRHQPEVRAALGVDAAVGYRRGADP
jgi:hypothetical protein